MTIEKREALGITDQLVRVSAGLENKLDIFEDIEQAVVGAKL